jgi:fluoride exporter
LNSLTLLLVALGGALGSVVRALATTAIPTRFPWGTIAVNVVGSLLIGVLMARLAGVDSQASPRAHALLVTGFCGGFTTFSAFSWQTFEQMQRGAWAAAFGNVALSIALCLAAVAIGFKFGRA